ncbi:hypothetical protein B0J12DRAFT_734440 [Macrophomina phaseolina]|nr:hypothetical protein B0J12DRAFT_734440 [Macrophomina phaseolina]
MQFSTAIISTALLLASGCHAWTNGVANNRFYTIRGIYVHEACTYANTETIHYNACAYWIDGAGNKFNGHCKSYPGQVLCI